MHITTERPVYIVASPPPADFVHERVIGHIAGEPAIGLASWADGAEHHDEVRVELAGLTLHCDGDNLDYGVSEPGCAERIPLWAVGRVIELHQAGHLDALVQMARRWRTR